MWGFVGVKMFGFFILSGADATAESAVASFNGENVRIIHIERGQNVKFCHVSPARGCQMQQMQHYKKGEVHQVHRLKKVTQRQNLPLRCSNSSNSPPKKSNATPESGVALNKLEIADSAVSSSIPAFTANRLKRKHHRLHFARCHQFVQCAFGLIQQ
jgi:hypothetical protein